MERVLNLALLKNPVNWVVVLLMVVLGNLALAYIIAAGNAAPVED